MIESQVSACLTRELVIGDPTSPLLLRVISNPEQEETGGWSDTGAAPDVAVWNSPAD